MVAAKGNKYKLKLKTPDIRQEAFRQYCQHLAEGWPKEAFVFDHPTISVTFETIESYIKKNPEEFSQVLIQCAMAKRFKHWMQEGIKLMQGGYKNGSPVVWQTIMRNLFKDYGWDKKEFSEEKGPSEASVVTVANLKGKNV